MNNEVEYSIAFTDVTICESGGFYDEILSLMKEEPVYSPDWTLRSDVTISSPLGMSALSLSFNSDKSIHIVKYDPAIGDVFYNPDLQILAEWASEHGWEVPEPSQSLIDEDIEFWKHFWETRLIDSSYLEEMYGKRDTDYKDDIYDRDDIV